MIFCFPSAFWPLKIKKFSTFILYFFTQICMILMFYFIGIGQNVDIYPSKRLWKLSVTKIVFQSQFYPLKINISLKNFTYSWAELNVDYVLKKSRPKSQFLPLKSARNFPADFLSARLQCSQLLWNCAKIKAVYRRARGERGLDIAQTIGPNCSMTHSPGKIEYNCRYFIMTFCMQIHTKKIW